MTLSRLATKFSGTVAEDGTFTGYGSTFGNVDQGGDVVIKGAFTKSLMMRGAPAVKMLWQHDPSQPIGVWTGLSEDEQGLRAEGKLLTATTKGRDVYEMMKAGAVDGLSIGFMTKDAAYDKASGARLLKQLDLREISVVTFPMNEQATIAAVKAEDMTERDFERILRDAGFSREFAKRATLHGFKAACEMSARDLRDAGEGESTAGLLAAIQRAEQALRT